MTTLPHRSFASADAVAGGSRRDDRVIEALYLRHKPAAVRYAQRRGAEDPEGLFDHVFADVLTKSHTLEGPTADAFGAYLYRSISNRVISERRKKGPPPVEFDERIHGAERLDAGFDTDLAQRAWLEELLNNLTESERTVVEKRYFEDQTSVETARAMGKSPEAVRQLHRSAMRRLRFLLAVAVAVIAVAVAIGVVSRVMSEPVRTTPIGSVEDPQVSTSTTAVFPAPTTAGDEQLSDAGPRPTLVVAAVPSPPDAATETTGSAPSVGATTTTTVGDATPQTSAPQQNLPQDDSTTATVTTAPPDTPAEAEEVAAPTGGQAGADGQDGAQGQVESPAPAPAPLSDAELLDLTNQLLGALNVPTTPTLTAPTTSSPTTSSPPSTVQDGG